MAHRFRFSIVVGTTAAVVVIALIAFGLFDGRVHDSETKTDSSPAQNQTPSLNSGSADASPSDGSGRPVWFRDEHVEAGLDFTMTFLPAEQGEKFKINLYDHGCGVSVADYDGDGTEIDDVEIHWPSGARQTITSPSINTIHEISEPTE
jgi:hypothetical protein